MPGFLAGMYAESADVGAAKWVLETEDAPPVAWNVVVVCCARLGLVDDVPFTGSLHARTRSAAGIRVGLTAIHRPRKEARDTTIAAGTVRKEGIVVAIP